MKLTCHNCGGDVVFKPSLQKCQCTYCGNTMDISDFDNILDDDYVSFHCSSCNADLIATSNSIMSTCLFCGSQNIISQRISRGLRPQGIIPFKIEKEEFLKKFTQYIHKRKLIPKQLKNKVDWSGVFGVYIPFYECEANEEMYARGRAVKKIEEKIVGTKFFELRLKDVASLFQDGGSCFDDATMEEVLPYDMKELKKFSPLYLAGFLAEKVDENDGTIKKKYIERIKKEQVYVPKFEVNSYLEEGYFMENGLLEIKYDDFNFKYYLFPVLFFNILYKGKRYTFAANGQNGRISGRIPIDKIKLTLFSMLIFVIPCALLRLLIGTLAGPEIFIVGAFILAFCLTEIIARNYNLGYKNFIEELLSISRKDKEIKGYREIADELSYKKEFQGSELKKYELRRFGIDEEEAE